MTETEIEALQPYQLKSQRTKLGATITARKWGRNPQKIKATNGEPPILHINLSKSLDDPWTTHAQKRLQGTHLQINELNRDHRCCPPNMYVWCLSPTKEIAWQNKFKKTNKPQDLMEEYNRIQSLYNVLFTISGFNPKFPMYKETGKPGSANYGL